MLALKRLCPIVTKASNMAAARFICWTGAAADNTIDLTFITPEGKSRPVKARIGDTLLETAEAYNLPICGEGNQTGLPKAVKRTENWTEETFGEGPSSCFCHVVLSNELYKIVPKPTPEEQYFINKVPIGKDAKSRLASEINVTKEMNGGIPHHVPNEIL